MRKKKKIIVSVIVILMIAVPISLYAAGNLYYSAERIYEQTWHIELPEKMEKKFDAKDENSPHNDGIRYTVFETENQSTFFDDFSSEKNTLFEDAFQSNLSALKIPDENQPDWDSDYVWKQVDSYENHLYMIFDPMTNMFFIMQNMQ